MLLGIMSEHPWGNALDRLHYPGQAELQRSFSPKFYCFNLACKSLVLKGPIWKLEASPEKKGVKSCHSVRGQDHVVLGGLLASLGDSLTSEVHYCNSL